MSSSVQPTSRSTQPVKINTVTGAGSDSEYHTYIATFFLYLGQLNPQGILYDTLIYHLIMAKNLK